MENKSQATEAKETGSRGKEDQQPVRQESVTADQDKPEAEVKAEARLVQKPYMIFDAGEVVQESGLRGIKFDFNYGARVTVPQGEYRVKLIDRSACLTVYDAPASGVMVTSSKKYFVDFRIEIN